MMMSLSVSRLPNPRPSLLPSSMARVSHSHSLRNSNFCSRPLCRPRVLLPPASARTTSPALYTQPDSKAQVFEENIEKVIYRCRFMALLGVLGSLIGSILCFIKVHDFLFYFFSLVTLTKQIHLFHSLFSGFEDESFLISGEFHSTSIGRELVLFEAAGIEGFGFVPLPVAEGGGGHVPGVTRHVKNGCAYVVQSFVEYIVNHGKVIMLLVEAIDVYLLGTVMLVFGMGLYELFVSNLGTAKSLTEEKGPYASNLFGLFTLKERPKWLDIKTVNELKTKVGHVIVMLLLIGLLDKCKKASINTPLDLLCFSASVLLSSGCLFLLSKLTD
ncbi:hypothetical protein G4B88_017102 [Cannabis sativa]|uniref:Uncharacterized protein n=1 Tax=Cannabis sativa TaxID=3483 RepID=A0A7J6HTV9_CANSA|nr:hypothetical protein G4B88_017102 [Cannabis sativa]